MKALTLCDQLMKQEHEYVYLGIVLSSGVVSESAAVPVRNKIGRVKQLILDIKTVVED